MIYEVWSGRDTYENIKGFYTITQKLVFRSESKGQAYAIWEKEKNKAKWQARDSKNANVRLFVFMVEINPNIQLPGDNGCYSRTLFEKSYSMKKDAVCVNTLDGKNEIFNME